MTNEITVTTSNYRELEGRVALVTGAAMGMGKAIAFELARAGASVAIADIDGEKGMAVAERIMYTGSRALFIDADVSSSSAVDEMVSETVATFGRLDIAVNNAAIAPDDQPIADFDEDYWDRLMSIDLKGVALCMKYEIRAMLASGNPGSIINLSSVRGARPGYGKVAYCAAKHGVNGMTKVAAMEYGRHGIRVNAVAPGAIDTPMLRTVLDLRGDDMDAYVESTSLLGRLGQPQDIAEACVWLASDRSTFITGTVLHVDAGYASAR